MKAEQTQCPNEDCRGPRGQVLIRGGVHSWQDVLSCPDCGEVWTVTRDESVGAHRGIQALMIEDNLPEYWANMGAYTPEEEELTCAVL